MPSFDLLVQATQPIAAGDIFAYVDISDTTQSPQGSTKGCTWAQIFTNPVVATAATITGGTVTANTPPLPITQTWNAGGVTFNAFTLTITDTASASASLLEKFVVGASTVWQIDKAGVATSKGGLLSSAPTGSGIGYATGAGSTITQQTNRTTAVTINTLCGQITTNNTSLGTNTAASFTVNNTTVGANDNVVLTVLSGKTNAITLVYVNSVASNSFVITVDNTSGSVAETGAIVIAFAVLKTVTA